jgi:glucosamine--fructose-6-phosphate aminotransferase (isomerizing)
MCGIVAYLGEDDFKNYILCGLRFLQNRGYDSVGISYISDCELSTTKFASTYVSDSLDKLEKEVHQKNRVSNCAIGHTRWATHGNKTDINAHPHHDNKNRISLVHNGIIENYNELKKGLQHKGYFLKSQTDTEIIAVLIGYYLDQNETMENAIQKTLYELMGTWALAIIHKDYPNKIWVTRNGSPLLLGMEEEYIMIASEQIAFNNYVKKYIVIDNHDLIEITKKDGIIQYNKNIQRYTVKEKIYEDLELHPLNYDHWMLKEISDQPNSILTAINNGGRIDDGFQVKLGGLDTCKKRLLDIEHVIILGCGTSFHSGLWSLEIFKSLDLFITVSIFDGADFTVKDIPKRGRCGIVLISQSGETKDLHRCIQFIKEYDIITIGVVNVVDSLIARETDCGVYLNAGREVAVASTKSFTNQCVILSMIAIWFSQNKNTCIEKRRNIISDLRKLSIQMQNILDTKESLLPIANMLKTSKTMFILGKGKSEAIAKEGSLKLKEVAYIHAEGYSSSALKHGPFALIEPNLPIILLDIDEEHRDKNNSAYQEIMAREANIIRISDKVGEILIEKNKTYGGLLANMCIQLLSYYIALEKNIHPDFPRNLAKVVTVE